MAGAEGVVLSGCELLSFSASRRGGDKLVQTLGITSLSKSQVAVMAKELDEHVEQFRTRRLEEARAYFAAGAAAGSPGLYYDDRRVKEPSPVVTDELAAELWERSEAWVA